MTRIKNDNTTIEATAKPLLNAEWQIKANLDLFGQRLDNLTDAIEALQAIAEAGQNNGCSQEARGLGWVVERMGNDLLDMQRDFEALRVLIGQPAEAAA